MSELIHLAAADGARATLHLQGAHVTGWWPSGSGASRLFLSERAVFAPGIPIRGGVPVIFPQFAGEGPLPKHGFARNLPWVLQARDVDTQGSARATLTLDDDAATRSIWPQAFRLTLVVRISGNRLQVTLEVLNTGSAPLHFTTALHTYLAVHDLVDVELSGLQGLQYRDTANGGHVAIEQAPTVRFDGEVDRNYFDSPAHLLLHDGARSLKLEQSGFRDTVVWNPGAERSPGFADLAADDYRRFVCVEAAAIQHPVMLAAGARWQGSQLLIA